MPIPMPVLNRAIDAGIETVIAMSIQSKFSKSISILQVQLSYSLKSLFGRIFFTAGKNNSTDQGFIDQLAPFGFFS